MRSVLHDLCESGLVTVSGAGSRLSSEDEGCTVHILEACAKVDALMQGLRSPEGANVCANWVAEARCALRAERGGLS